MLARHVTVLQPSLQIKLRWRQRVDAQLRDRIERELHESAWALNEMEALLLDAHRSTGLTHAWLAPSLEMRLPLFDMGRRLRIRMTRHDRTRIVVVDEHDTRLVEVKLE